MDKPTPGEQPTKTRLGQNIFERCACFLFAWLMARQLGLLDLLPFARGDFGLWMGIVGLGIVFCVPKISPVLRGLVAAVLGLWLLVAFTGLSNFLIQPLKVADPPQKADAVVVLQAGIQQDNDFYAPTLQRTLHALELIQEDYAPILVLTEDGRITGSHQKAASRLMKNLRIQAPIFAVGPVQNTHDEAVLVTELARQKGWKKILLVTSPTHSKRGKLLFVKTGLQVVSNPCQETVFDFENMNESDPDGRLYAFSLAMREIVGIQVYRMRGWI